MAQRFGHWGDEVALRIAAYGQLALGIDPAPGHAPAALGKEAHDFLPRYCEVLLASAEGQVGFVKFQSAFFEAFGSPGVSALAGAMAEAKARGLGVILDAKRGDIGSTAEAYAQAYLDPGGDLETDALTVNPFLGPDTMEPFVDRARRHGKGLFVLCKTSNPGSGWLQDQVVEGAAVSHRVAAEVERWACETRGCIGAVVGATWPEEARALRALMPTAPILAPGLGPQGGDLAAVAALAAPTLIPVSRGIAAAPDRGMGIDAWRAHVVAQIASYKAKLAGMGEQRG